MRPDDFKNADLARHVQSDLDDLAARLDALVTLADANVTPLLALGARNLRITAANAAACAVLGQGRAALERSTLQGISAPLQAEGRPVGEALAALAALPLNGHPRLVDWLLRAVDGAEVPCVLRSAPTTAGSLLAVILRRPGTADEPPVRARPGTPAHAAHEHAGPEADPGPPAACDTEQCLLEALARLQPAIRAARAEVRHGLLPTVSGHADQLVRLFQSLVDNAIKFRRRTVAPLVEISAALDEGCWRIEVRDNGIGVPPDVPLFGPAASPDGTGREPRGGLAACARIVERHGGRLWIEPHPPGGGSRFCFTLPMA